jgi:hypothetical protein
VTRDVRRVVRGSSVTHFVTLLDIESAGAAAARRRFEFLREVIEIGFPAGMLACGPLQFEKFEMKRLDDRWVVELEATEETS